MIKLNLTQYEPEKVEKRNGLGFDLSLPFLGNWSSVFGFGNNSDSGEVITWQTSLQVSTVWAAVRIISESVGSLPCKLYSRTANGRKEEFDHPVYKLLRNSPNDEQTGVGFWELMCMWLNLHGNAYAQIQWGADGRTPVAFWPLRPDSTYPFRLPDNTVGYRTTDGNNKPRVLASKDILHFMGISTCGLVGLSPIQAARQSIGLARATERYGSRLFKNSSVPALVLTTDKDVKPEIKQQMRRDFEAQHLGENQHRVAVLDQGLSIEKLSISAEDSQFLETRAYQRADIAAIFRIAPHLVGSTEKISNSNLVQENLQLVTQTLRPWLCRLEAEVRRKVLDVLPANYEVEFDTSELTRGDAVAESAAYTAGIQGGWLCPAEVRHDLKLNAGPECLNVYRSPLNYQNSERLLDAPEPAPTTTPTTAESSELGADTTPIEGVTNE